MTRVLSLEKSACFVVRSSVTLSAGVDRRKRETEDSSSVCVYLMIRNKKSFSKRKVLFPIELKSSSLPSYNVSSSKFFF